MCRDLLGAVDSVWCGVVASFNIVVILCIVSDEGKSLHYIPRGGVADY